MEEEEKAAEDAPWYRPGFWNKLVAITLGYGGVMVLAEVECQRRLGGLDYLDRLDSVGLMTLIVIIGTLATHALRSRCFARDEWRVLQQAVLAMNGILAVLSSAVGQQNLALICVLVFGIHIVVPRFMKD